MPFCLACRVCACLFRFSVVGMMNACTLGVLDPMSVPVVPSLSGQPSWFDGLCGSCAQLVRAELLVGTAAISCRRVLTQVDLHCVALQFLVGITRLLLDPQGTITCVPSLLLW
jgi:hypothetical protein